MEKESATAAAARFDRETGEYDHTEILTTDTTEADAKEQATLDARIQTEDNTTTLHWATIPGGGQMAASAHNLYTVTFS